MTLVWFVCLAAVGSYLLRTKVLPMIEARVRHNHSPSVIAHVTALPVIRYVMLLMTLAWISGLAIIAGTALLRLLSEHAVDHVRSMLQATRAVRELVEHGEKVFHPVAFAILLIGLFTILYRSSRTHMRQRLAALTAEEDRRLVAAFEAGRWERRPPTAVMQPFLQAIAAIDAKLASFVAHSPRPGEREYYEAKRQKLAAGLFQLDLIRRRRPISIDASDLLAELPTTAISKIGVFVGSRGMTRSVGWITRGLAYAMMLFFVPSIIGVETRGILPALHIDISQLALKASMHEAETSLKEARSDIPASAREESDEAAAEKLARYFQTAWQTPEVWDLPAAHNPEPSAPADVVPHRTNPVRYEILATFAQAAAAQGHQIDVAGRPPDTRTSEGPVLRDEPIDAIGKTVLDCARRLMRESPATWRSVKVALRDYSSSFGALQSRREQTSAVLAAAWRAALGGAPEHPEAAVLAKSLLSETTPEVAEEMTHVGAVRYLAALAHGQSLDQARGLLAAHTHAYEEEPAAVVGLTRRDLQDTAARRLAESWRNDVALSVQERRVDAAMVEKALPPLTAEYRQYLIGEYVKLYEDVFPASELAQKTQFAAFAPDAVQTDYARSRSFAVQNGSRDVGGVVLGRPPDDSSAQLDFVDFAWRRSDHGITFVFARSDGKQIDIGPFRETIAAQALAYAADGRPTTVTILNERGARAQKVLLHPALLDTTLGCRTIQIDKLVFDRFPTAAAQIEHLEVQDAAYRFAWSIRAKKSWENDNVENKLASLRVMLDGRKSLPEDLASVADGDRSPLPAKPDYYDPSLVAALSACKTSSDREALESCLSQQSLAATDLYGAWYPPVATFVSGVRDEEYVLDDDLRFLTKRIGSTEALRRLWPLEFRVQAVFETPAHYDGKKFDSGKVEDLTPWAFPSLRDAINARMSELASSEPESCTTIQDLQEFAIAQRLFRLVLDDRFGSRFPTRKLGVLARDLASTIRFDQPTARWNLPPSAGVIPSAVQRVRDALAIGTGASATSPCGYIAGPSIVPPPCSLRPQSASRR